MLREDRGACGRKLRQARRIVCAVCVASATVIGLCLIPHLVAQTPSSSPIRQNSDALVREVIHNEIESQLHDNSLWCYREEQQEDSKPSKTLEICETKDGNVERLLAVNGKALNLAQREAEEQRIRQAIKHPEQIRAKQRKDHEDGEQQRNMLKTFPDAFHFQWQSESGNLVTLHFEPNPAFHPYTRAATVFHHLEGTLIVDRKQKRLVEVNGRLMNEVRFAGGLLGHLDKNGTFLVKQEEVSPGHWDLRYLNVHMSGKALLFKTINVLENKSVSDYHPFPRGASLQQAADFLTNDFEVHTAASAGK